MHNERFFLRSRFNCRKIFRILYHKIVCLVIQHSFTIISIKILFIRFSKRTLLYLSSTLSSLEIITVTNNDLTYHFLSVNLTSSICFTHNKINHNKMFYKSHKYNYKFVSLKIKSNEIR